MDVLLYLVQFAFTTTHTYMLVCACTTHSWCYCFVLIEFILTHTHLSCAVYFVEYSVRLTRIYCVFVLLTYWFTTKQRERFISSSPFVWRVKFMRYVDVSHTVASLSSAFYWNSTRTHTVFHSLNWVDCSQTKAAHTYAFTQLYQCSNDCCCVFEFLEFMFGWEYVHMPTMNVRRLLLNSHENGMQYHAHSTERMFQTLIPQLKFSFFCLMMINLLISLYLPWPMALIDSDCYSSMN